MAKDGNLLHLELLKDVLCSVDYYRQSEISAKLLEVNVNPRTIKEVIPRPHRHDAPTRTSVSYNLDLIDSDNNRPRITIHSQFYYTGMRQMSTIGTSLSPQQRKENLVYREKQFNFLKSCGLPAPIALGIESKSSEDNYASALLTEYWGEGTTHSLDLLAINQRLQQINDSLQNDHSLGLEFNNEIL